MHLFFTALLEWCLEHYVVSGWKRGFYTPLGVVTRRRSIFRSVGFCACTICSNRFVLPAPCHSMMMLIHGCGHSHSTETPPSFFHCKSPLSLSLMYIQSTPIIYVKAKRSQNSAVTFLYRSAQLHTYYTTPLIFLCTLGTNGSQNEVNRKQTAVLV